MKVTIEVDEVKLTEAINAAVDIPYVPESTEAGIYAAGVQAGASALAAVLNKVSNEYVKVTVE